MMKDDLGARIKENYEKRARSYLTRRTPVIIRIDGKAFHTFCKRFEKPYDEFLNEALNNVMKYLCENIQGTKFAERHSDEISLLLTDYDTYETDCWFDYNTQKICSVSASMATAEFCRNLVLGQLCKEFTGQNDILNLNESFPNFDARCFNLPEAEISNYFYWRMLDAKRSSVNMLAQCNFSHKSLQGLSCNEMQEKLWQEKQINWAKLPQGQKIGFICEKKQIKKPIPSGPKRGEIVMRNAWVIDGSPATKTELDERVDIAINNKKDIDL